MSAGAATPRRAPGWLVPAALVLLGVGAMALIGRDGGSDTPLDPRSHDRLGTSAFVALADELGADARATDELPGGDGNGGGGGDQGPDVFVLLADLLDERQQARLEEWVEDGGTLVVVDPGSTFTPEVEASFADASEVGGLAPGPDTCDVAPLEGIDVEGVEPRNGGVLYRATGDADTCLGSRSQAYIVATPTGQGTVVAVGGSGMFVNVALAEGENAPVVAALVAPRPGTRVAVLEPGPPSGAGERTLVDLIAPNVRRFLAQLAIAFGVFALWRSRRLGDPVDEPQPVAVAGSELVSAVGSLLDRSGSPQHAADLLRADLRRFLGDRLGVPADAPASAVAAVATERVGADGDRIAWALGPTPVADDEQLVALAHTIDTIREEVLDHV